MPAPAHCIQAKIHVFKSWIIVGGDNMWLAGPGTCKWITLDFSMYYWSANLWTGLPRCKNLWHFFFVLLAHSGVWLLFNGLWALLFSLFYVIREFDKFLHRGWALWIECSDYSMITYTVCVYSVCYEFLWVEKFSLLCHERKILRSDFWWKTWSQNT